DRPGGADVVLLSHGLWQRRFGGRPDVLGQSLDLDGRPHTIVGVLPRAASLFPFHQIGVWTPRPQEVSFLVRTQIDGGGFFFNVVARLKPHTSLATARAQVADVACLLLIASANVANLALARYAGRRKQIAIRYALGARRRHVISEMVAENVALALLGGGVGVGLASVGIGLIKAWAADRIPRA